ncbi:hypothetical protein QBC47DRAFT_156651 [Echria macrotheca]|uniref:PhoD-like phosphatase domain-containing protein n=1 Tax=Echria macrotheca TaxID=438768 RepID=A0AAJ0FBL0_9PEZI|nr:hypothetical protein QBC47DRAFT_156651 [Echria macrotheca]
MVRPDPDADLFRDDDDDDDDLGHGAQNPYASASQWRHQESSSFSKYARREQQQQQQQHAHHLHPQARDADSRGRVSDLADFLNSSRIAPPSPAHHESSSRPTTPRFKPVMAGAAEARATVQGDEAENAHIVPHGPPPDGKDIAVGPLINYRRMEGERWFGSVLVVTKGGGRTQPLVPVLKLRRAADSDDNEEIEGLCLYSDPRNTFWRFDLAVAMGRASARWEYELPGLRFASKTKPRVNSFWVPAVDESMRIMFYSCNGFSVGTDEKAYSGACLWNDVMRRHGDAPFHVMLGGGDQIYCDAIRVKGPLQKWTGIGNPKKRREYPFPESLRAECDNWYLRNYIRWYGTEPFAAANGQIPQMNIWDDHDIIDGFGSYVNEFMKCDVFKGIGGVAHKYYMLFQHHLPPPASTYTSDAVPAASDEEGQGVDPNQMANAYVHPAMTESNYIVGPKPGPYVAEHSHNIYAKLGARIAFLGIDARTERTRHQVNYPETYDQIFSRLRQELSAAASAGNPFKHLIVMLGIPIAYPRLTWLENVFSSPILGPIKFMNRRMGLGGSFFNSFDGSVDLLDDLDDHYTARTHKKERNQLIRRLQGLCADFSVRITILGGDVHLAALGRFYSRPKLHVPIESDYRYMANVISSAIVNKPPPGAVANLLSRRNKIHHLGDTDETLLKIFDRDPGDEPKTASHNQVTMPSRNFAIITENSPANAHNGDVHPGTLLSPRLAPPPPPGSSAGHSQRSQRSHVTAASHHSSASSGSSVLPGHKDGRLPIHAGEVNAGTKHKAASTEEHGKGADGSLDICLCVEIDQHNPEGLTRGYGISVPVLEYRGVKAAEAAPGSAGSRGSEGGHEA